MRSQTRRWSRVVALARVAQLIWRSISDTDCSNSTCRRLGFLGLCLCKQLRCLPVGEPRLEAAIHGKHEHDHFDKGGNVFAEEASGPEPVVARCLCRHSKFSEFRCRSLDRTACSRKDFCRIADQEPVAHRSANDWLKQPGKTPIVGAARRCKVIV